MTMSPSAGCLGVWLSLRICGGELTAKTEFGNPGVGPSPAEALIFNVASKKASELPLREPLSN